MGSVYLRENSWVVKYKDENDNWKRKTLGRKDILTKTMAREILKDIERKVMLGQHDMVKQQVPTLRTFSREYIDYQKNLKQNRSWQKDESHLRRFNSLWGDRKLSNISAKEIDDYKTIRLQQVKPATVNRELAALRHLFYLAEKWDKFYGKNPVAKSGLLKEDNQQERILSYDEEEDLIRNSSPHLVPILITALNTGMRKMEVLTLTWEDIDFDKNLITIRKDISKSKKVRRIPINSKLRRILLKQKIKTQHSGHVFLTNEGLPYSPKNPSALKRAFGTACKKAGIEGLRFHDLRHTAATRMIENTGNIVAVSKILGHANIKTTMRYAHPEQSLIEALESLNQVFSERDGHKSGHIEDLKK